MYRRDVFAFVLTLCIATFVFGHEGNVHVMGTVAAFDANHVVVKTADGKTTTIPLTKDTKYIKGAGKSAVAGSAADLSVGQRVVVDVAGKGQKAAASQIRLGVLENSTNMQHSEQKR